MPESKMKKKESVQEKALPPRENEWIGEPASARIDNTRTDSSRQMEAISKKNRKEVEGFLIVDVARLGFIAVYSPNRDNALNAYKNWMKSTVQPATSISEEIIKTVVMLTMKEIATHEYEVDLKKLKEIYNEKGKWILLGAPFSKWLEILKRAETKENWS